MDLKTYMLCHCDFLFPTQAVHLLNPPSMVEGILSLVGGQCHALDQGLNLFSSQRWRVSKRKRCDSEWLFTRWNTFYEQPKRDTISAPILMVGCFYRLGTLQCYRTCLGRRFCPSIIHCDRKPLHWSDVHWCLNDTKKKLPKTQHREYGGIGCSRDDLTRFWREEVNTSTSNIRTMHTSTYHCVNKHCH